MGMGSPAGCVGLVVWLTILGYWFVTNETELCDVGYIVERVDEEWYTTAEQGRIKCTI
jgi:hypothetical protein